MYAIGVLHHLLIENNATYKHTTNIHETLVLWIHPHNHACRIFIEVGVQTFGYIYFMFDCKNSVIKIMSLSATLT